MTKDTIPMNNYCPRSKYPLTAHEIIKMVTEIEDQWNEQYIKPKLPKYEEKGIAWTPASIVGMAGNCIKSLLP